MPKQALTQETSRMLVANHELNDCLDRVDRLGVFPAAATEILELSRRPDATLDQLETAVELDPVLAGRILKVANSPLYARQIRIGELRRALQMLGFTGTRDIAIALAIGSVGRDAGPEGEMLWRHGLSTGWACRVFARNARGVSGDAMFVAGLLHDLGIQLLLTLEPEGTTELIRTYGIESPSYVDAERHYFGFDHAELAGECLRRWKLPLDAVELVERHHDPVQTTSPGAQGHLLYATPRRCAILAVADQTSEALVTGAEAGDLFDLAMGHPAAEMMRISRGGLLAAFETLVEHRDQLTDLD
ncbi:MAG: HDOD domain-containing protein [Myxococcota bacterium]